MNRENERNFDQIIYYFERHIEVDGDSHGPMALDMIKTFAAQTPLNGMRQFRPQDCSTNAN